MVEDDAISSVTVLGGSGMGGGVLGGKSYFLAGSLSGLAGKLEVMGRLDAGRVKKALFLASNLIKGTGEFWRSLVVARMCAAGVVSGWMVLTTGAPREYGARAVVK